MHRYINAVLYIINQSIVEPIYKGTHKMRMSPLIRTPCTVTFQLHRTVYKTNPEMRTPPLLNQDHTLSSVSQGCLE